MAAPGNDRGQMLLAEEFFSSENSEFVATLRKVNQPRSLAALADRWKKDPRPWARAQIFAYLAQPLNGPGHQPLVKHLFKHAEENADHELMAAFLPAFDRQVRRVVKTRRHWDRQTRQVIEEQRLATPRDVIPSNSDRNAPPPVAGRAKLFRYRTRYYLRRRAWRFFRRLGHRDPAVYISAIAKALPTYEDSDLQRGENILDSWGLMHACFAGHDALEFTANHIRLKEGRTLGELSPAPQFPEVWKKSEAAPLLVGLVAKAKSRLVRLWAMQSFLRDHASFSVPVEDLAAMLEHEEADVQQFAAKLFETSTALATLPVTAWLKLLRTKNDEALQRICGAFAKNVAGNRLDLPQCVELASARPVAVARLGRQYLRDRVITSPAERAQISLVASANCSAVAGELAAWALGLLGAKENYACDQIIRFFDSTKAETRAAAWEWLVKDSAGLDDAVLWSRLSETPYDDVRLRVVDFLHRATSLAGTDSGQLENLWRSVLLGVHRGGRQKALAVRQVARAIIEKPERAETLLPVLAVALRSVRGPEARAGLAAIVSVVEARPQIAAAVKLMLPELKWAEAAA